MNASGVEFVKSFTKLQDRPKENLPEIAFIGRSNVGKSSLINALCKNKKLAKISSTPGKTKTINFFNFHNSFFLVDLPGYGYAKHSKTQREEFKKLTLDYLKNSPNLFIVFVLIDGRHSPMKLDLEFVNEMGELKIPIALIFTKKDKVNIKVFNSNIYDFTNEMSKSWIEIPKIFETSSVKKTGIDKILDFISLNIKK